MKSWDMFILFLVGAAFMLVLFFGSRGLFQKAMSSTPKVENTRSQKEKSEQAQRMRDVRERQKRLMQDQQRRIRDMQRRTTPSRR